MLMFFSLWTSIGSKSFIKWGPSKIQNPVGFNPVGLGCNPIMALPYQNLSSWYNPVSSLLAVLPYCSCSSQSCCEDIGGRENGVDKGKADLIKEKDGIS